MQKRGGMYNKGSNLAYLDFLLVKELPEKK